MAIPEAINMNHVELRWICDDFQAVKVTMLRDASPNPERVSKYMIPLVSGVVMLSLCSWLARGELE